MTPSDSLQAVLDAITPEQIAAVDRKLDDPNFRPREGVFRDDPDPFGRDWDWLLPDPDDVRPEGASK